MNDIPIIGDADLKRIHTGTLLRLQRQARGSACEYCGDNCNRLDRAVGADFQVPGVGRRFVTQAQLTQELGTRAHFPRAAERKKNRLERLKAARSKG